jgi:hypothetical protein
MSGNTYSPKPPMVIANQPSATSMMDSNANQLTALLNILKGGVSRKRYSKIKNRKRMKKTRRIKKRRHVSTCKCKICVRKRHTSKRIRGGIGSVVSNNLGNGLVQVKVPPTTYPETAVPSTSQATASLIETSMQAQANSEYDLVSNGSGSGSGSSSGNT